MISDLGRVSGSGVRSEHRYLEVDGHTVLIPLRLSSILPHHVHVQGRFLALHARI